MMRRFVSLCAVTLCAAMAAAAPISISQVTKDKVGSEVEIAGEVISFQASNQDKKPNSLQVQDPTGKIRVAIWNDAFSKVPDHEKLATGSKVEVKADVAEFRNALELHVKDASGLKVAAGTAKAAAASTATAAAAPVAAAAPAAAVAPAVAGEAKVVRIGEITDQMQGQPLAIVGKVDSARKIPGDNSPYVVKVSDPSGSIEVVFWEDTAKQLTPEQKMVAGDNVKITGKVSKYRDKLQFKADGAKGIEKVKPGAEDKATSGAKAEVRTVKTSELAQANVGERVQISAHVANVKAMRAGHRVVVDDQNGRATLLVWDTAEGLVPAVHTLASSNSLTVAGIVREVDGVKALVVSRPEDVISLQQ